jgi:methyl-accepting chemotaxis protein
MLIILFFCITVATAIMGLTENADRYSEFYNVGYQITNKVMSMRRGLQIIVKDISFITMENDAEKSKTYSEDLQKELTLLEENASWLFENFTGDQALLDSFAENVQEAVSMQQTVLETSNKDLQKAQEIVLNKYQPLVEKAVNTLIQISESAEASAETDYQKTTNAEYVGSPAAEYGRSGISTHLTAFHLPYQSHHQAAARAGRVGRQDCTREL